MSPDPKIWTEGQGDGKQKKNCIDIVSPAKGMASKVFLL